ncbi:MAG: DUF262 domain-containing protein [Bacteroides sp.]|nr:DUF262 domain-containing protein [Bacteroides sp.]
MENFRLCSVSSLRDKSFFIPNYQRGYKWEKEQVVDLLNDIEDFMNADHEKIGETYCIQPLVVGYTEDNKTLLDKIKETDSLAEIQHLLENRSLEVIDGQQRLTTIFLILSALGINKPDDNFYSLEYETRHGSWNYLQNLSIPDHRAEILKLKDQNEDYYHMHEAYETIRIWFSEKDTKEQTFKSRFSKTLLTQVKFIWYHSLDPNPVLVFRRLNDGKIGLTDAELIKAFILHCDYDGRKAMFERAAEWDTFEYQLQDDEFWLFMQNDIDYHKPTRIEWIFDLIRNNDLLRLSETDSKYKTRLGNDNHKTFRYFDLFIRHNKEIGLEECSKIIWNKAKSILNAISEWYSDSTLYHHVGYCIHQKEGLLIKLYAKWSEQGMTKSRFHTYLRKLIAGDILSGCSDLSARYQENEKRKCLPLLLLHNIEEVLWQNRNLRKEQRFGMGAFYRFPFHLYKKEERKGSRNGWEIEHIASNSGDADDAKQKAYFLAAAKIGINNDDILLKEIEQYDESSNDSPEQFSILKQKIAHHLKEEEWSEDDKNMIWNFTLLDSGTNQEYQNAVFPFKRLYVINKEDGIKTTMKLDPQTGKALIDTTQQAISFIPPITKKIFTKAFSKSPNTLISWTHDDAKMYLLDLELKTEIYLPKAYRWLRKLRKNTDIDGQSFLACISESDLPTIVKVAREWKPILFVTTKILKLISSI